MAAPSSAWSWLKSALTLQDLKASERLATWCLPMVTVPFLSAWASKGDEHKVESFVRDATRYVAGTGVFFGVENLASQAFKAVSSPSAVMAGRPQFTAMLTGLGATIGFNSFGAERLASVVAGKWRKTHPDRPENVIPPPGPTVYGAVPAQADPPSFSALSAAPGFQGIPPRRALPASPTLAASLALPNPQPDFPPSPSAFQPFPPRLATFRPPLFGGVLP